MPSNAIVIKNGCVYDPANDIDGEKTPIYIKDGKIVDEKAVKLADAQVIDAGGCIVMPGGVDIHTHIAGPKVDSGRLLRPEDHRKDVEPRGKGTRSGVGYSIPSTFTTGYRYARMGWTTVIEPAVPPLKARHVHEEFNDMPIVDKACYPLFGGNWFVIDYIKNNELDKLTAFVAWMLWATKGYAVKMVNPGGVESWKWGKNCDTIDEPVKYFEITPRQVITSLAKVNERLHLPHTIHVHPNNLGHPGNIKVTLETLKCVEDIASQNGRDSVIHLTHAQFHAYGGEDWKTFSSAADQLVKYVNVHKRSTLDMGQVIFTDTTTMTADGPMEYNLHKLTGLKWVNADVELETSAGIVPYIYRKTSGVNAIQWAMGLEIALGVEDPWRIFLTTDHPNGGPFTFYPSIISWLVSKKRRETLLRETHEFATSRTTLPNQDREYTMSEIAIITRAGIAKAIGMANKGHLGVGADADVAIYNIDPTRTPPSENPDAVEKAFKNAKYTIARGNIVVKDGEVVSSPIGRTHWLDIKVPEDWTKAVYEDLKDKFVKYYTVNLQNYPVQDEYLASTAPRRLELAK
jgi:formylmethanofuran dehydrogenase subunit A